MTTQKTIALIADDDEFFCMALSTILTSKLKFAGVVQAASLDETVEKLSGQSDRHDFGMANLAHALQLIVDGMLCGPFDRRPAGAAQPAATREPPPKAALTALRHANRGGYVWRASSSRRTSKSSRHGEGPYGRAVAADWECEPGRRLAESQARLQGAVMPADPDSH